MNRSLWPYMNNCKFRSSAADLGSLPNILLLEKADTNCVLWSCVTEAVALNHRALEEPPAGLKLNNRCHEGETSTRHQDFVFLYLTSLYGSRQNAEIRSSLDSIIHLRFRPAKLKINPILDSIQSRCIKKEKKKIQSATPETP